MKNLIALAFVMFASIAVHANSKNLVCWDKRSSSRIPALRAEVDRSDEISNIAYGPRTFPGSVVGVINDRAIKYKNHYYFQYRIENSFIETILPKDFANAEGYFDAATRSTESDGGGTTFLRCRID